MVKRRHGRLGTQGQSILEYVVIATVIVAAIMIARGSIATHTNTLFTNASTKVSDAATSLGNFKFEGPTVP